MHARRAGEMAELAFGAVHSLLGLLREEAQRLIRVGDDVRFIQEEMESMESFLQHLAVMTPPSGEHDPPVRTWMKQVRDLAFDCSNCIDLYVRRGRRQGLLSTSSAGDHHPGGRVVGLLRSMLPWSYSSVTALLAQRDAAAQISQLKVRARDVGERRQRYGVKLPKISDGDLKVRDAGGAASGTNAAAPLNEYGGAGDKPSSSKVVRDDSVLAYLGFSEPDILKDCTRQLVDWLTGGAVAETGTQVTGGAVPEEETQVTGRAVAEEETQVTGGAVPEEETQVTGGAVPEADAEAQQPTPNTSSRLLPPPLDKVIGIVAPDKEDGCDFVRNVLLHPKVSEAKLFDQQHPIWLPVPTDFIFLLEFYKTFNPNMAIWFLLHFIMNILAPPEGQEILARDQWGEAEFVDEIRKRLQDKRSLFVIEASPGMGEWHLMEEALARFGCAAGSSVIVVMAGHRDDSLKLQTQIGSVPRPIIVYSLVEHFSRQVLLVAGEMSGDYLPTNIRSILREIQERCEPQVFCMKMFVHYLYGNLDRTKEQIDELLTKTLAAPTASAGLLHNSEAEIREINGRKLVRFCYADLPRAFRSCLLYLAIFPPGKKIRRSRLVVRWVVEGLVTGRDMRRAARNAERCFDTLLSRWFVCPGAGDIGDARRVKSCVVQHRLVQELIEDGAKEERFLEPRLSRHLAQHFSIHCDLQLRRSDSIHDFMLKLGKKKHRSSSQATELNIIKVFDLEGFQDHSKDGQGSSSVVSRKDLIKDQSLYLRNVCSNMLLLKYLSIRNTSIDKLPKRINNLQHLEVLDIRQTKVPWESTGFIMLPRLRCLLAGHTTEAQQNVEQSDETEVTPFVVASAQIPASISRMPNIEVLSHVRASKNAAELEDIGRLWQLWKLGVVIDGDMERWLKAIGDLNECLRSLSIHINCKLTDSCRANCPSFHLELLKRLSIRGDTSEKLLPLFLNGVNGKLIAKLTLRDTLLEQNILNEYLNSLPSLQCLKLKHESYSSSNLVFENGLLPKLRFLIVKCHKIMRIDFKENTAPKLEKIVWSFAKIESLSGIKNLYNLKEIELRGDGDMAVLDKVRQDVAEHSNGRLQNGLVINPR